jgi:hypothetical protein
MMKKVYTALFGVDRIYRYLLIFCLILVSSNTVFAARQNLDEALARKTRYSSAQFYAGPQNAPYYFWQPETLNYTDTNYGTEVWRVLLKPGVNDIYAKEYSVETFNYNGSKIGFFNIIPVWNSPDKRLSNDPNKTNYETNRWVVNTDGSKLRIGTKGGLSTDNPGFVWMHTESAYLFSPYTTNDPPGSKLGQVYKVLVDENNAMTRTLLFDTNDGLRKNITFKDSLTADDKWLVTQDDVTQSWPTPLAIDSRRISFLNLQTNTLDSAWGAARGVGPTIGGDLYGETTATNQVFFRGPSTFVVGPSANLLGNYYNVSPFWWLTRIGSAADGGPKWNDWDSGNSNFGTNEIKPLSDDAARADQLPHNPYDNGYAGHIAIDRWGRYAHVGNTQDCNDPVYGSNPVRYIRWGNNGCPGRIIVDFENNMGNPSWFDVNNSNYMYGSGNSGTYVGAGHGSWTAWSDYLVLVAGIPNEFSPLKQDDVIWQNQYNKTHQVGKTNTKSATPIVSTEYPSVAASDYTAYARPSQSPDGTKVAFSTVLFHSPYAGLATDGQYSTTAYVVAIYPYPPEIKSAVKNGNNVRLTWDFNQGTSVTPNYATPRTYTKRGWPNETTDRPPSPREVKQFRVWSSADNTTWTPVGTTTYGNTGGNWTETSWYYDVLQSNSTTTYYATTSMEHSGLESRTLSNIWKVVTDGSGNITAQAENNVYPVAPGGKISFYTTTPKAPRDLSYVHKSTPAIADGQYTIQWNAPADKALVRFYNIYAKDGSLPITNAYTIADRQKSRIASIPASSDYTGAGSFKYVDWLGAPDGTTKYIVTAVDYQGNETADVEPPISSVDLPGGSYQTNTKTLTLSVTDSAVAGNDPVPTIYYTLDGSTPTTGSTVYTVPIVINSSTTLKFFAVDATGNTESLHTEIYYLDTTPPTVTGFTAPFYSTTLNVTGITFTASDNVSGSGVKEYCITTTNSSSACTWSSTAPTNYTATADGSYTLFPWARDNAGNNSNLFGTPQTVVVDTGKPSITAFTAPSYSAALNFTGIAFTASDNAGGSGVKEYCITTSNSSSACTWSSTAPTSYTAAADGSYTLYPWARDNAGNNSNLFGTPQTVVVDTGKPSITAFTAPSYSAALNFTGIAFTASDNAGGSGVKEYCITTSNSSSACTWSSTAPTSYTAAADGSYTLYPWARDNAGNNSNLFGTPQTVVVDTGKPSITAFTAPSYSAALNFTGIAFTASDNAGGSGVKEYCITTSNSSSACTWSSTAPTSYTAAADGSYTLFPWARDNASNISDVFGTPQTVDVDTGKPTITLDPVTTPTTNATQTITGTVTDTNFKTLTINDTAVTLSASNTFTHSVTLAEGSNTITIIATDNAGNSATKTDSIVKTTPSTVTPSGDISGDTVVDIADALKVLRIAVGLDPPATDAEKTRADVAPLDANGKPAPDGVLDIADAVVILQKVVGLRSW